MIQLQQTLHLKLRARPHPPHPAGFLDSRLDGLDPVPPQREAVARMDLADVQRKLADGFRPFVIRTSDGHEFSVPHKEFIFLTKRSVIVADEQGFVDILDPAHITSLRELGALPARE